MVSSKHPYMVSLLLQQPLGLKHWGTNTAVPARAHFLRDCFRAGFLKVIFCFKIFSLNFFFYRKLTLLCGSPGLCLQIIAVPGTQLFSFKIMNIKLAFKWKHLSMFQKAWCPPTDATIHPRGASFQIGRQLLPSHQIVNFWVKSCWEQKLWRLKWNVPN